VLLVAPPGGAPSLKRGLATQGWPVAVAADGRAAARQLAATPADVAVVAELPTPRATVALLRRLGRAAPALRSIVLLRRAEPAALLAYANEGGARSLLAPPQSAPRLVGAVRQLWKHQREARKALLRGGERSPAMVQLQGEMQEHTQALSHANRSLRKALREIAHKNRALLTLNKSLRIQSTTDALTGLYNRREFLTRIRTEWGRFRRYGRPLSLIMLDIDRFKRINDTHGHECGDHVLRSLGHLISKNKRAQDLCCRYGGEEFVVLLTETTLEAAFHVAEGLRRLIAQHVFDYDDKQIEVRVSLGVSGAAEQQPADVEAFINQADKAMYRAKREGRDRTVVLHPEDPSRILRQSVAGPPAQPGKPGARRAKSAGARATARATGRATAGGAARAASGGRRRARRPRRG
jgi:diguanylate cyclase (GGDEF)-like protein